MTTPSPKRPKQPAKSAASAKSARPSAKSAPAPRVKRAPKPRKSVAAAVTVPQTPVSLTDVAVHDLAGKEVERIDLNQALWDGRVNLRLLSQALHAYRGNLRAGTASTKRRGDVSGGGKKPWKQKHTGRARAGSTRSPLWRHGGSVFGPKPRSFRTELPKAIRRRALLESLKGKLQDRELLIVSQLAAQSPKTKPFAGLADAFSVSRKSIIVLDEFQDATVKSLRNLPSFELHRADDLNAFDVLNSSKVLVTKAAFQRLEQRLLQTLRLAEAEAAS